MDEQNAGMVEAVASEIHNAIGDDFKWEWDDRFKGALTQLEKSNELLIQRALSLVLAYEWRVTNIKNAPEAVLIAADFLGGLRSDQHLHTTSPDTDPLVVAALWPWGNGVTVSLRVIPFAMKLIPTQMAELHLIVRTVFNI